MITYSEWKYELHDQYIHVSNLHTGYFQIQQWKDYNHQQKSMTYIYMVIGVYFYNTRIPIHLDDKRKFQHAVHESNNDTIKCIQQKKSLLINIVVRN